MQAITPLAFRRHPKNNCGEFYRFSEVARGVFGLKTYLFFRKCLTRKAMIAKFILTDYVNQAMSHAEYDKLKDGTFAGKIPECPGVISFATTLRECEETLHSVLEDWVFVGLKLDQTLPVIDGIDLNQEPAYGQMASM